MAHKGKMVRVDPALFAAVEAQRRRKGGDTLLFGARTWIATLRELVAEAIAARESSAHPPPVADVVVAAPVSPPAPVHKEPKRKAPPGRAYTECLAALESACGNPARFVIGDLSTLTKGQVMQLHRVAKKYAPEVWERVGRYVAAVPGVHDRGSRLLTARWVAHAMDEAVQASLMWEQRGGAGLSSSTRARLDAAVQRSGGKLASWEDRTLSPDEVAGIEAIAADFEESDWARLGEWIARGGLSWFKDPVVPARLFVNRGREWFQRALSAHRPQVAPPKGGSLLDLMGDGEIKRVVDHRR